MKPSAPVTSTLRPLISMSTPPVAVLEPHDVVFAEIRPRLHFDDLERYLAGVGKPVRLAERDVGALVLGQHRHRRSVRHLGRSRDDHPVLGAVAVSYTHLTLPTKRIV